MPTRKPTPRKPSKPASARRRTAVGRSDPLKSLRSSWATRLDSVVGTDTEGRPVTARERLLAWLSKGIPYNTSLLRAGASHAAMEGLLRRAAKAEESAMLDPAWQPTEEEAALIVFAHEVEQARAEGEARYWELMFALAEGYAQRTTTIKVQIVGQNDDGSPIERVVEKVTKEENVAPDFRAVRWLLEVGYGRREPLEVKLNEGRGPLSPEERLERVIAGIMQWKEQYDELRALEAIEASSKDSDGNPG